MYACQTLVYHIWIGTSHTQCDDIQTLYAQLLPISISRNPDHGVTGVFAPNARKKLPPRYPGQIIYQHAIVHFETVDEAKQMLANIA